MDLFDIAVASKLAGGGGEGEKGKATQINNSAMGKNSASYIDSGLNLIVAKTGIYDIYWVGINNTTSGGGSQLVVDGSDYGEAQETFDSTSRTIQYPHISNVSLMEGQVVSLKVRSKSISYAMWVSNLTIIEA